MPRRICSLEGGAGGTGGAGSRGSLPLGVREWSWESAVAAEIAAAADAPSGFSFDVCFRHFVAGYPQSMSNG